MGILDASRADNPFADYTFVFVPYCTGDFHLGDAATESSPELTVRHNGWVNGTAALTYVAEHFAAAAEVVVVGESAGLTAEDGAFSGSGCKPASTTQRS
jgi:hypothetical protein